MRLREAKGKLPGDTRMVLRFILFPKLLPISRSSTREWRTGQCVIRQQAVRVRNPDTGAVYLTWEDQEWAP